MIRPRHFLFGVLTGVLILTGGMLLKAYWNRSRDRQDDKAATGFRLPSEKTMQLRSENAKKSPPNDQARRQIASGLDSFLAGLKAQGQVKIMNRPDGHPFQITGIVIRVTPEDWNSIIHELANQMVGVPVQFSPEYESVGNPSSDTVTLRQTFQGRPVYGGVLRVMTSKDRQEIFEISSDLKAIGQVDPEIVVSEPTARSLLVERWRGDEILSVKEPTEPVVFTSEGSTQAVLAWRFLMTTAQPRRQGREVLISAKTGEWLKVRNTQINK